MTDPVEEAKRLAEISENLSSVLSNVLDHLIEVENQIPPDRLMEYGRWKANMDRKNTNE